MFSPQINFFRIRICHSELIFSESNFFKVSFASPLYKLISVAKQKAKMRLGGIKKVESQNSYQAFKICLLKFKTKVIFTLSV